MNQLELGSRWRKMMVIFLKYSELTCIVFCVLYMKPRARRWEVQGKVKREKRPLLLELAKGTKLCSGRSLQVLLE